MLFCTVSEVSFFFWLGPFLKIIPDIGFLAFDSTLKSCAMFTPHIHTNLPSMRRNSQSCWDFGTINQSINESLNIAWDLVSSARWRHEICFLPLVAFAICANVSVWKNTPFPLCEAKHRLSIHTQHKQKMMCPLAPPPCAVLGMDLSSWFFTIRGTPGM